MKAIENDVHIVYLNLWIDLNIPCTVVFQLVIVSASFPTGQEQRNYKTSQTNQYNYLQQVRYQHPQQRRH
ncbi:hypothetical protein LSM04_005645 [Trypanosoma melophagium]|uniref:uncharacterized protein n=1 Tax=Trypanosoma melophagium TaxID=715481 RepID=UPI00351A79AD|nr:hypothetical protein LSM04_005645 [Trypanosoma melophagium]